MAESERRMVWTTVVTKYIFYGFDYCRDDDDLPKLLLQLMHSAGIDQLVLFTTGKV